MATAGALWVWTVTLIPDKKTFWKYFLIHSLIFTFCSLVWRKYSEFITGHDEYGLGQLMGYIILLVFQSLIGFIILKFELNRLKRSH